jgi:predicted permease
MGIPLRRGRDFTVSDAATAPKVTIIDQTFADRYLPGVDPLGHRIAGLDDPSAEYTIVGVAQNSRYTSVRETERPMAFVPFSQAPGISEMQYELHTSGDPRMLIREAARTVHELDPNLPLDKPATQQEQFAETVTQERLIANLSISFGLLAAFLVAIGLYGTISYSVGRRTQEIGVRMTLGAQRTEVLRMILLESLAVAAAGLAVGIPASLAIATTLRSMLYGLRPSDPLTLVMALAGISIVTLAAALVPARRAASIDPIRALRME